ncbi:unnamed protein product, partial [Closterium sp. NIES-54]
MAEPRASFAAASLPFSLASSSSSSGGGGSGGGGGGGGSGSGSSSRRSEFTGLSVKRVGRLVVGGEM